MENGNILSVWQIYFILIFTMGPFYDLSLNGNVFCMQQNRKQVYFEVDTTYIEEKKCLFFEI